MATTQHNGALPVIAVTGMAFEARIARGDGVEAVFAARADRLERALADATAHGCAGIVSFGTAGGLAPDLAPGALVIANAIDGPFGRVVTDAGWSARLVAALQDTPVWARVTRGTMAAVGAPVVSEQDKASLHHAKGALAVDMESHIARPSRPRAACRSRCAARSSIRRGARCRVRRRPACATTA
ncbi:phosphorylase domain protein, partial [Burkholderia cenocepacia BC7]